MREIQESRAFTNNASIRSLRFSEDLRLLDSIESDERIATHLRRLRSLEERRSVRGRLLSCAVRVDSRVIPRLARAFAQIQDKMDVHAPLEAYVYDHPCIQAAVMRGRSHTLVLLSSSAVNRLDDHELEFVVGHELGHTIFNHLDVAATHLVENEAVDPRSCLKLLAWQRASEITADRCGLVCCGSLQVAATALFKTLSGLDLAQLQVDPMAFAEQWEYLANEVIAEGGMDDSRVTHPFPPLRVKAMIAFWESAEFHGDAVDRSTVRDQHDIDAEIARMLAMIDPLSRDLPNSADPILEDFFLWGGLYIAFANDEFHDSERTQLATMVSENKLRNALDSGICDAELCRRNFRDAIRNRQKKLKAMEVHRILQGLLQVALSDGTIDDAETAALKRLAEELGIGAQACDLLISNMLHER